ncbi:MAG: conjugal transfer protein TraX, partial [Lachnospiraceae bacterium]|nr:conjugal transfer protein TraX [Lachnospiraceae bacterium]
ITMYLLEDRKETLAIVYLLFCIAQFSDEQLNGDGFPLQWFMVLALPFILRYNGKRGKSYKYFFYFFYPAHTFLLFYLANFVWK